MNAFDLLPADGLSALLLFTALKGAIILVGALLVTRVMTRTSAAARHAVWVLAFGAALVMPALLVAVPGWQIPVLPEGGFELGLDEEVAFAMPGVAAESGTNSLSGVSLVASTPSTTTLSLGALLLLFWALGAFFVATRWFSGTLSAWVLTRGAIRLDDPGWRASVAQVRASLGIRRSVELRMSAQTRTPMTWGIRRPVVLLPETAIRWSVDRRAVVLTHELAHVRRLDGVSQLVVQAACVLHWFNPFAWIGYQRFLIERECACDDYVLEEGTRASSYAEHLLEIARGLRSQQRAELAMAPMAHRTQIEERLRSILNDQQSREKLSRSLLVVVCTLVFALVWPVAAIDFVARDFQAVAQDAPIAPVAPRSPQAPAAHLPALPPAPPSPPVAPVALDVPEPPPAPPFAWTMNHHEELVSGPAPNIQRMIVHQDVTEEQRRLKHARDNQFNARIEATLASEMEDLHRSIQVDVDRIVREVEDDRWEALDEQTRGVVQQVENAVERARAFDETEWHGQPGLKHSSVAINAVVVSAVETKQSVVTMSRPSASPNRTLTNSDTCRQSGAQ